MVMLGHSLKTSALRAIEMSTAAGLSMMTQRYAAGIAVIGKKTALMNINIVITAGIMALMSRKKTPSAERIQVMPSV